MESKSDDAPLIVIVGETASGKTTLSLNLAQQFSGEIICADSRTIYTGMDIGTAKPTRLERQRVPHHLLDIAKPDQPYSAAAYKRAAQQKIAEVAGRQHIPFLVGGTGLYIDAVLYDFAFRRPANRAQRSTLQQRSIQELQQLIHDARLPLPNNPRNPRHLIRQLETNGEIPQPRALRPHTLVLALSIDRSLLEERIRKRVASMIEQGLEQEVRRLQKQYGWTTAMQSIGYQEFQPYFDGQCSLDDVQQKIVRHSLQYAKRQRSWFRRNKSTHYISNLDEAVDLITTFLNK